MPPYDLTPGEYKLLRSLKSPARIQAFLEDKLAYNKEPGGATCYSPRRALAASCAHCMEGAVFAAAALRVQGYPPLLFDLEAQRDDDHVLAVFQANGCWGAIGKSNYSGLRYREPVYRSLRELAMSYFESYFNLSGYKSLRAYSGRPVNLKRFDKRGWMTSPEDIWYVPEYLCEIPHTPLLHPGQEKGLAKVDDRSYRAGRLGSL